MPQAEALACGIPIASIDYSAMEDIVKFSHGIPLKVAKYFVEMETHAIRVFPDNEYCAKKIEEYLLSSPEYKREKSEQARRTAIEKYDWDKTAKIWEHYFDSAILTGLQGQWESPYRHINPPPADFPKDITNEQFVISLGKSAGGGLI